ncbi:hypothetical protein CVT25_009483 [Psilocybe cyanescens]|uniref:Uncharacterized protein n=1 Tax=Psilocybe cyanescens TaxID=93625 RepID=A0A409XD37_PSICY|nr:hypothetical protein CVT25_009483 [Psilocybe cyanescens]
MLISGSLAILAAILLIVFKNNQGGSLALEILGYAALFLNISACTSGFILIDRLGNMSWDASQDEALLLVGKAITTQQNLLRLYGVGTLWFWVMWHYPQRAP